MLWLDRMGAGARAHSSELNLPQTAHPSVPNRAATYPAELRVRLNCHTVSDFLDQHAPDVSRGGIFVRHGEVLPVGRAVRLNLQLADGTTLLAGEGTVFWTREADPARAESEPGMGIRFTRLTTDSQRMLTHLLAEKAERERLDDGSDFDDDERTVVASEEELRAAAGSGRDPSTSPSPLSVVTMEADFESPAPISSPRIPAVGLPPPFPQSPAVPTPAAAALSGATVAAALSGATPFLAPLVMTPTERTPSAISHPRLPIPAAAPAAAWEIEDAPFERMAMASAALAPEGEPEYTELVPRTRRNIGVGIAVGALAAMAACFVLLRTPAAKPRPAPAAIAAPVAAAPMPVPAVVTETAVIPVPSTPITPALEPAIPAAAVPATP